MQRRRGGLTEPIEHLPLDVEIARPPQVAVEVVGVQPERPERDVDGLTVGNRRPVGKATQLSMMALVRRRFDGDTLPQQIAGLPVVAEHNKLRWRQWHAPTSSPCGRSRRIDDRRGQEQPISPDDRRREPASRDGGLPLHVLGRAEHRGRVGVRNAVPVRPPPMVPVTLGTLWRLRRYRQRRQQPKRQHADTPSRDSHHRHQIPHPVLIA